MNRSASITYTAWAKIVHHVGDVSLGPFVEDLGHGHDYLLELHETTFEMGRELTCSRRCGRKDGS